MVKTRKWKGAGKMLFALLLLMLFSAFSVPENADAAMPSVPIYQLYNSKAKDHYYTRSASEYNRLGKKGWKKQGVAWYAPESGSKVYGIYNKKTKDHQYVNSAKTARKLAKKRCVVMMKKGRAVFSRGGEVKVYKAYNKKNKDSFYTCSYKTYRQLKKKTWKKQGVAFCAYAPFRSDSKEMHASTDSGKTSGASSSARKPSSVAVSSVSLNKKTSNL